MTDSFGETIRIDYVPRPGLGWLSVKNFLLSVITLGIYRFWGKTNVRKHIWGCVHINGQALEYTGRGMELFLGFLIILGLFILPLVTLISIISIAYGPEHPALVAVQLLFYLIVLLLWGAALYRARRYQLSRTLWRGIGGTLAGSSMIYSLTYFGSFVAQAMSFGWSTPVLNTVLQEQIIGDMRFGNLAFKFRGRAGPLYPTYAICWFLSLLAIIVGLALFTAEIWAMLDPLTLATFGEVGKPDVEPSPAQTWTILKVTVVLLFSFLALYLMIPMLWSIYHAKELSTFANYTSAGGLKFKLNATPGNLISLVVINLLIIIFTLGIGRPFTQQRLVRYLCDHTEIIGMLDVDKILQSKFAIDKTGEGLADAFDLSAI